MTDEMPDLQSLMQRIQRGLQNTEARVEDLSTRAESEAARAEDAEQRVKEALGEVNDYKETLEVLMTAVESAVACRPIDSDDPSIRKYVGFLGDLRDAKIELGDVKETLDRESPVSFVEETEQRPAAPTQISLSDSIVKLKKGYLDFMPGGELYKKYVQGSLPEESKRPLLKAEIAGEAKKRGIDPQLIFQARDQYVFEHLDECEISSLAKDLGDIVGADIKKYIVANNFFFADDSPYVIQLARKVVDERDRIVFESPQTYVDIIDGLEGTPVVEYLNAAARYITENRVMLTKQYSEKLLEKVVEEHDKSVLASVEHDCYELIDLLEGSPEGLKERVDTMAVMPEYRGKIIAYVVEKRDEELYRALVEGDPRESMKERVEQLNDFCMENTGDLMKDHLKGAFSTDVDIDRLYYQFSYRMATVAMEQLAQHLEGMGKDKKGD